MRPQLQRIVEELHTLEAIERSGQELTPLEHARMRAYAEYISRVVGVRLGARKGRGTEVEP